MGKAIALVSMLALTLGMSACSSDTEDKPSLDPDPEPDFSIPFTTVWETTTANETISIPIYLESDAPAYNYTVDCGADAAVQMQTEQTTAAECVYPSAGTHTIQISGTFPRIYFNNSDDKDKIRSVDGWGDTAWTSMENAFFGAGNLVIQAEDTPDFSNVTNMSGMFRNAAAVGGSGSTGNWNWDISNITNMSGTFHDAAVFNQNLSSWDISAVINFENIFNGSALSTVNYNALVRSWNSQFLTRGAKAGTFHAGSSKYSSSAAADRNAFAAKFGGLADSGNTQYTDDGQHTIVEFTSHGRKDRVPIYIQEGMTVSVTSVASTGGTGALTYSLSGLGSDLFTIDSATGVIEFKALPAFDSANNANNAFVLPVKSADTVLPPETDTQTIHVYVTKHDTDKFVTTWEVNVAGDSITVPIFTGSNAPVYNYTRSCGPNATIETQSGISGAASCLFLSSGIKTIIISGTFPRIYFSDNDASDKLKIRSVEQWGTNPWTSMKKAFFGARSLRINAGDVPNFSGVTDMTLMFSSINTVGGSDSTGNWKWDTANVTNMQGVFALNLVFNQDISTWNTANVTNMYLMFFNTASFDQDIGAWDISSVANFEYMLSGAALSTKNYDSLLSGWHRQMLSPLSRPTFNAGSSKYSSSAAENRKAFASKFRGYSDGGLER